MTNKTKLVNMIAIVLSIILSVLIAYLILGGLYSLFQSTQDDRHYGIKSAITNVAERAYYEGQVDALKGDIRVQKVDSTYVWIKSPWDDGTKVTFNPLNKE